jgi:alpha-beta hydrolase superfamily lysophospholipase
MTGEDARLAARYAGHRILLCYGLFGEVMAGLRLDYMRSQADWLRSLGLAVEVVALPTAAPVLANAGRIAERIAADPRPGLLVGHSKGGLEALAALLRPGMAERCSGLVALQSPFLGSPVADALCGIRPLHHMAHRALQALRLGDGQGLRDLTTPVRTAWMAENARAVAELARVVPIAVVATTLEGAPRRVEEGAYRLVDRWMQSQGVGESDGLVPLASARLPGLPVLVLPGGHRALVACGPGRDPLGVLRARLLGLTPPPLPPAPAPHPPTR